MNIFGLIRATKSSYLFLIITCNVHCSIAIVGIKAYTLRLLYSKGVSIIQLLSIVCLKIGLDSASLNEVLRIIIFVKKVYLNEPVVTLDL